MSIESALSSLLNMKGQPNAVGGLDALANIGKTNGIDIKNMLDVLVGAFSPQILTMAENQASQILGSVKNPECVTAMANYIDGFLTFTPELWAVRMFDATAKLPRGIPTGGTAMLGDYDECIDTEAQDFSGQYCLLTACFKLGGKACATDPLEAISRVHAILEEQFANGGFDWPAVTEAARGMPVRIGLCLPSVCKAQDIVALTHKAVETVFPMVDDFLNIELNERDCRTLDDEVLEGWDFMTVFILMFIGLMVGLGTAYHYASKGRKPTRSSFLKAFSVTQNLPRLFETRINEEHLPGVDGLRTLSMMWVVSCHAFIISAHLPIANVERARDIFEVPSIAFGPSGLLSVDTFLVMSGMLVSYVYLRRSATGRSVSLIGYYLLRLVRLVPCLALVLLLQSTILLKLRDGPLWRRQPAQQCPDTWWYILLQICNYFRPDTVQCMVHLWYLSLDWQLYVFAPLALIWMRRRPRRVLLTFLVLGIGGTALRFWVAYNGNHVTPWGAHYSRRTMEALYFPTHMRFVPYLMGLALGYEIYRVKILKYPSIFSQRVVTIFQMSWPLFLLASIAWVERHMKASIEVNLLSEALHITFLHVLWATGISMLLYLCIINQQGPVSRFLSLGLWQPITRLSYGVYLLHMPILDSFLQDTRDPVRPYVSRLVVLGFGCYCAAHIPALALWLGVEAPIANLTRSCVNPPKGERKRPTSNGVTSGDKQSKNTHYIQINSEETTKSKSQKL